MGDLTLGARSEIKGRGDFKLVTVGLLAQLDLATGHADDPDNLIDIPIGRGYPALILGTDTRINIRNLTLGLKNSVMQGMESRVSRRVPEGEEKVVGAERKSAVDWTPGRDVVAVGYVGAGVSFVKGSISYGIKRHYVDKYRGAVQGNYGLLADGSDQTQNFGEFSISLDTVNAYARKKFAIPMIISFMGHETMSGINVTKEQYFEISLTSFFQTPQAAKTADAKTEQRPVAGPSKRAAIAH
jgi:hypothetical protein